MHKTRDNHYVPQWYQKGFYTDGKEQLRYLSLQPKIIDLPNGDIKKIFTKKSYHPSQCFYQTDLYTTFFGEHINDDIERVLFGQIDDTGSNAVRAYISGGLAKQHKHFENFFTYLDAQKIRTPKGLDWIQHHYPELSQLELMIEMQAIRAIHCTLWTEGVREIVSAKDSDVKFIISDHPVTVYNYACSPHTAQCIYPNDPDIALKATQTIYPLDQNHAIILTNLEYAQEPEDSDPFEQRTHSQKVRPSLVRTDAFIRSRNLSADEVTKINLIIKSRAKQFIAAGKDAWLYPEKHIQCEWADLRDVLLPPCDQMFHFGGEMYVGYEDGSTHYQDAFGRKTPENKFLKKDIDEITIGRNDACGCGSGKKYKRCCIDIPIEQRTSWKVLSIRERNIAFYNAIYGILGLDNGKTWDDVRRELSDSHIKDLYSVYGSLWPISTDIYELLPKPDGKLRGLYSGFIDPRSIGEFALSMTPYFDEMLIEHPFMNPNNIKPEFSPIESPSKNKCQALKDIFFLLMLEPFVRSGFVNIIPDPCSFDYHLHRQMMNIATQNKGIAKISSRDKNISLRLNRDDFNHTLMVLPEHMIDRHMRDSIQGLSDSDLRRTKTHLRNLAEEDPLALLQEVDFGNGGQFIKTKMAPNYEMALFVAQVTGSLIFTDSETRWSQFGRAQCRGQGMVQYPWKPLNSTFFDAVLYDDLSEVCCNFTNKEFIVFRKVFKELNAIVRECSQDMFRIKRNERQLIDCFSQILASSEGKRFHLAKFEALIPKGGFVDRNVQRLLLTSNCDHYQNSVPMIFFVGPSKEKGARLDI